MAALRTLLFSLIIMLGCTNVYGKPLNLNQIIDASCRVSAPGGIGSGMCFAIEEKWVYFISNQHVCGSSRTVHIEQFRRGRKTGKIPGTVVKTFQNGSSLDFAIIAVDKSLFKGNLPRAIPLAPQDYVIQKGTYIASSGCPSGGWLNSIEGNTIQYSSSRTSFVPVPLGGQSGSGIVVYIKDKDGEFHTYIAGLITWRVNNEYGAGVLTSNLLKALKGQVVSTDEPIPANFVHPILLNEEK